MVIFHVYLMSREARSKKIYSNYETSKDATWITSHFQCLKLLLTSYKYGELKLVPNFQIKNTTSGKENDAHFTYFIFEVLQIGFDISSFNNKFAELQLNKRDIDRNLFSFFYRTAFPIAFDFFQTYQILCHILSHENYFVLIPVYL